MLSFEIPNQLFIMIMSLDLKKCLKLVEIAIDSYPKEKDSVVKVILESFEFKQGPQALLVKLLIDYHDQILLKNSNSSINDDYFIVNNGSNCSMVKKHD